MWFFIIILTQWQIALYWRKRYVTINNNCTHHIHSKRKELEIPCTSPKGSKKCVIMPHQLPVPITNFFFVAILIILPIIEIQYSLHAPLGFHYFRIAYNVGADQKENHLIVASCPRRSLQIISSFSIVSWPSPWTPAPNPIAERTIWSQNYSSFYLILLRQLR